jgi:transcriptional regulator with GAF, ATPase, and Fis domain
VGSTAHRSGWPAPIKTTLEHRMVASPINQPEDLHLLKEKCRNLESQCAAYIRSLEAANHNLAAEITRRKKAEEAIQNAHDELEKLVAERTKEIRLLKDRLQAENVFLKQELAASHAYGTIIGDSHPIKTVISQIELVAPTDANVLIHGESGTGKELVAREIHKHSSRKEKPLIKVNCATIPKELYESEFFGHVKGSFTGAVKDRIGRFEAADGGTIFQIFNHWPPTLPRSFPES